MLFDSQAVENFASQTFAFLEIEESNHVLTINLNRPEKKNAFTPTLLHELAYALAYARHNPQVWAVVLAAKGDVFCAGMDLKVAAGAPEDPNNSTIPRPGGEVLIGEELLQVHKPVIGRIQGPVLAGGFLLICGCTYVVASDRATFSLPEAKRGLWPMQVMASLRPILPARVLLDLCLRCPTLSAAEAMKIGLITHSVPADTLDTAIAGLTAEIFEQSPTAIRMGFEAFEALRSVPEDQAHAYLKGQLMKLIGSADAREGMQAFLQKRKPEWTGQ
jgi:enoyl-CoA hydratase/carnithine racemase